LRSAGPPERAIALPLVLAGPIVRRVEPRRASFWIALSEPGQVGATVFSGPQVASGAAGEVMSNNSPIGTAAPVATRRFGQHLHVAVVTVRFDTTALVPGTLYSYDLLVEGASFPSQGLKALGLLEDKDGSLALGYIDDRLPAFATTPTVMADVHFAHSSCRKTNGPRYDALAWLDKELEDHFTDAERLQQLYLTGDQIYADDVASCLLPVLTALGHDLLGGDEKLTVKNSDVVVNLTNFPVLRRQRLVRQEARFTSTDADNHLLGFGEYAAMYLASWSPRVWRDLAGADDVFVAIPGGADASVLTDYEHCHHNSTGEWKTATKADFDEEVKHVQVFRAGVPHVARVLANVPTYMILDDHEVTDDWNINKKWKNQVYTRPLGGGIIRNGLLAYGIFQGWGNDPQAFADPGNNKDFLDEAEKVLAGNGPFPAADTGRLEQLFGFDGNTTVGPSDKKMRWHYTVPATAHLTIVMDSRTRRTYSGEGYSPPDLLGNSLDTQIPNGPLADGRDLLIVVAPAPVLGPALLDRIGQPLAQTAFDIKASIFDKFKEDRDPCRKGSPITGAEEYDAEGWSANEEAQERLLAKLAGYNKVVLLSGDVHYGCSLTLDYWRKGVAQPSRIVQLTSSSAHNRFKAIVEALLRNDMMLQLYKQLPAERLAWKAASPIVLPTGAQVGFGRRARMRRSPSLLPSGGWPASTTIPSDKPPDWSWRLHVVRDGRPTTDLPAPLRTPALATEFNAGDPIAGYRLIAGRHAHAALTRFDPLRQVVFATNVGVVSFDLDGGALKVTHTLLSQDAPDSATSAENTVHSASLGPTVDGAPQLQPGA
jgi:hypothetical protein